MGRAPYRTSQCASGITRLSLIFTKEADESTKTRETGHPSTRSRIDRYGCFQPGCAVNQPGMA